MGWTYRISALGILPFGLYAVGDDFSRLWMGGGEPGDLTGVGTLVGFSLILPALINLLNDQYGRGAHGLRVTALIVNLFMFLLLVRLEAVSGEDGMFLLLPALFLLLLICSGVLEVQGRSRRGTPPSSDAPVAISDSGAGS